MGLTIAFLLSLDNNERRYGVCKWVPLKLGMKYLLSIGLNPLALCPSKENVAFERLFSARARLLSVILCVLGQSKNLIKKTLPDDARKILRNCFKHAGDSYESIAFLDGLESRMHRHAMEQPSPFGFPIPPSPHQYQDRCEEFDLQIRDWLFNDVGPRMDPNTLALEPVADFSLHNNLQGACKDLGVTLEQGFADSVDIDAYGRAKAAPRGILRLSKGEIFMDVAGGKDSFHVARFVATDKKISPVRKFAAFVQMIKLLHRTAPIVTGKVATKDDPTIHLNSGNWRFKKEQSVWNFPVSRLEKFWMRAGAVQLRVLRQDGDPSVIALLREDEAVKEIEKFSATNPAAPSPWFYASNHGIYSKNTLKTLNSRIQKN
jgi:hypothetical protein